MSSRKNIERIFGSWLSHEDVQILKRLKDSQRDYLGMDRETEVDHHRVQQPQLHQQQPSTSIADELIKLANLKEKRIIWEEEFRQMKQDLIKKTKI